MKFDIEENTEQNNDCRKRLKIMNEKLDTVTGLYMGSKARLNKSTKTHTGEFMMS